MNISRLRPWLAPLSPVYGAAVSLRNALYDCQILASGKSRLPVICVGNVTTGGSGKSPFCAFLAQKLAERGRRPVILSRGYKGSLRGPHQVKANDSISEVGDEPLMHVLALGDNGNVVISADRLAGARFIEENDLGDIVVLDDGYQHRRLERDLNILLLDVSSENARKTWQEGNLLPAGSLREPLCSAIRRAQCVVYVRKGSAKSSSLAQDCSVPGIVIDMPCFNFTLSPCNFVDAHSGETLELEKLSGTRAKVITAIASPQSFLSMLSSLGIDISDKVIRPDHFLFSKSDWAALKRGETMPIITTAKDAVKLAPFVEEEGQLLILNLSGSIDGLSENQEFWALLQALL